ncbi:MAG: aspartate--ammonia ligase, partial [Bacilli bacterium]|nr:aspartate--ammonia ligase [Bacilli bacterium]
DRIRYSYHQAIINKQLPLTIGGGIGQSRICQFLLEKKHIGEVQASYWPNDMNAELENENIIVL